jgi:hypothetical protein
MDEEIRCKLKKSFMRPGRQIARKEVKIDKGGDADIGRLFLRLAAEFNV